MNEVELFTGEITRSYADPNRELVASFVRYMEARGLSSKTVQSYRDSCSRLAESMGSQSMLDLARSDVRVFLAKLLEKGLTENSVRLHTAALRSFYKFIRLSGLTQHDPTLLLSHRKTPSRLPRVLSIGEVEELIGAAQNPFERALAEVLYSTGVRVSELVQLRLENIDFGERIILVKKGKGKKDRYVPFGRHAAKAMWDYIDFAKPTVFLFESPAERGHVQSEASGWYGVVSVASVLQYFKIGSLHEFPTEDDARKKFEQIALTIPGVHFRDPGPYSVQHIRRVLKLLALRAGIGHVHPHSLRRAMASHMLSSGADLRSIQTLLGHERLGTTMLYTHLNADEIKRIHQKCHPHEQGGNDAKKE